MQWASRPLRILSSHRGSDWLATLLTGMRRAAYTWRETEQLRLRNRQLPGRIARRKTKLSLGARGGVGARKSQQFILAPQRDKQRTVNELRPVKLGRIAEHK